MKSKVLLIDDSVTIHRVIDLSIDVDRYDIVKVFSKEDAALKMQSEQYDYILLDNKLDNIIISEYIKELKAAQLSASIILLVGAFDRFDESDLEKTGADDYLVKPFDSQSLNEKLSSDADMMPAGIVEKIAEADFARDNDDYITPTASLTTGEVIDSLSKKEYLENLEEVQPDDLTDNGYAEDLDTAPSLEFDKLPKEAEEALQQNQEEPQEETAYITAESSIIEENPQEDIIVAENNDEKQANISFDEQETEPAVLDEPAVEEPAEPVFEQDIVNETAEETFDAVENKEVVDMPAVEETPVEEAEFNEPVNNEVPQEEIPLTAEVPEEENAPVNTEEIEIPDHITAVHNPVLPDIDDAADISDEYVMQDNLEEVDNISKNERLDEFPDFPDVDDISTDEMQDTQETAEMQADENENMEIPNIEDMQEALPEENIMEESADNADEEINEPLEEVLAEETVYQEEAPAEEQAQEILLVDDDDWLSDASVAQEETSADIQSEDNQLDLSEEITAESEEDTAIEEISADNNEVQEEAVDTAIPVEETQEQEEIIPEIQEETEPVEDTALFEDKAEETADSFDIADNEPVQEEMQENAQEEIAAETAEETVIPAVDELPEMPSLEEMSTMAESIDTAEENPVEDMTAEEETIEPADEEVIEEPEEVQAEDTSFDMPDNEAEEVAEDKEISVEKTVLPLQKEEVSQEPAKIQQTEVKQAEEYSPETTGRFGGITVTISRDEIIAMLGNAIDKHFLEEAVKEVIASNMKEIVRNIVPAIAEKYIKEEIERLKNDE